MDQSFRPWIRVTGNIVQPIKERFTPTGKQVCEVRIAVNNGTYDKAKKQHSEKSNFYTIVVWGDKCQELAGLEKGHRVLATGSFKLRYYPKKDGTEGHELEINAEEVRKVDKFTPPSQEEAIPF